MAEKKREVVEEMLKGLERTSFASDRLRRKYQSTVQEKEGQSDSASPQQYAADQMEERAEAVPGDGIYVVRKMNAVRRKVDQIKEKQHEQRQNKAEQTTRRQGMPTNEKAGYTKTTQGTGRTVQQKSVASADAKTVSVQKLLSEKQKTSATKIRTRGLERIKSVFSGLFKGMTKVINSNIAVIVAGAAVVVFVVMLFCMVGMIFGSAFGIFFTGTQSGSDSQRTVRTVMSELDAEYDQTILSIQGSTEHDVLELHGARPEWKEVLAVYAVKTNLDPNDSDELITMTKKKEKKLWDVFWDMVSVNSKVETEKRMVMMSVTDESGNVTEKTEEKEVVVLTIRTTNRSANEMAVDYGFDPEQEELLKELLDSSNDPLWAGVIY
jgi:hypothetical protein